MALDSILDTLKELKKKKQKKIRISKRTLFRKRQISKIKGSICNIPIEAANTCNILPRPAISNGLIIVKLKRDLIYRGHVYFEPVRPHVDIQGKNEGVTEKIIIDL